MPIVKLAIHISRESFTTFGGATSGLIGSGVRSDISGRGGLWESLAPAAPARLLLRNGFLQVPETCS